MSIIQLLKEEQQKYFEYSINTNEAQKKWANYFNKYTKSEILYDNMSTNIKKYYESKPKIFVNIHFLLKIISILLPM